MSLNPQELQKMLDELEASRASRKRAWESFQELRWVLKDIAGIKLPRRPFAVRSGTGPNEANAAGGIEQRNLFSSLRIGVSVWPES
jgi:hypothetical protein